MLPASGGQSGTRVGFISAHSHSFCDSCNRIRVAGEGRLLLCLGQEHLVDLRQVRCDYPGDAQLLHQAITACVAVKPKGHDFIVRGIPVFMRHMSTTGG